MQTFLRFLMLLIGCGIVMADLTAQGVHRLVLETGPVSVPDAAGNRQATLTLQAVNIAGQPTFTGDFAVDLSAALHPTAGVVISELGFDGQWIEFLNVGSEPVDMSGWTLEVRGGGGGPARTVSRLLHPPAVLEPGGIVVWSTRPQRTDTFPNLSQPGPFPDFRNSTVQLYDAQERLIDQLCLVAPTLASKPIWIGPPVAPTFHPTNSLARAGVRNQFGIQDWLVGPATEGHPNPSLATPWIGSPLPEPVSPSRVTLSAGSWTGNVRFRSADARHVQLRAALPNATVWTTAVLPIPRAPTLPVQITQGSLSASEDNPGVMARFRIQRPPGTPAASALPITITFDAPGEFSAPQELLLPAEQASLDFAVSNLDDNVADGRAAIRMHLSAPGTSPAVFDLLNDDNELGQWTLLLPSEAAEGTGRLDAPGVLLLPSPALHDVLVHLTSTGRVSVRSILRIPKDSASASFPVQVTDDVLLNGPEPDDGVEARMNGWPTATARIRIADDESPRFRLVLPTHANEGDTLTGRVEFESPVQRPRPVRLTVTGDVIQMPEWVTVPAGVAFAEFPIAAPDDGIVRHGSIQVCPSTDLWAANCSTIHLVDNDSPLESIRAFPGERVLSGDGVPLSIELISTAGAVLRTNTTATVEVQQSIDPVEIPGGSHTVPIVAGKWSGTVPITGHSPAVVLAVTVNGITTRTLPISVQMGSTLPDIIADITAWPRHTTLLALRIQTNAATVTGELVELDPASRTFLRRLPLPRPAHRLTVSDSGTVAWLASTTETLQRIQLEDWIHAGEFPLAAAPARRDAFHLALSPASTEDLLVLVESQEEPFSGPPQAIGVRNGVPLPQVLDLGPSQSRNGLIPGRTPNEFHVVVNAHARRVILESDGPVEVAARDQLWSLSAFAGEPVLIGTNLVFGGGFILDPDSYAVRGSYVPPGSQDQYTAVLPLPEQNRVLFAVDYGGILTHDLSTRAYLGRSQAPWHWGSSYIHRMVRWGRQGCAMLSWVDRRLFVLDDPVRLPRAADLSLRLNVQERVSWTNVSIQAPPVSASIVVSNVGPQSAQQVSLLLGGSQIAAWELLLPGTSVTQSLFLNPQVVGSNRFTASVVTATPDPDPTNNIDHSGTWVDPIPARRQATLALAARHLRAHPKADTLWAAVGPESAPEGIALLEANTLERLQTLPIGPDPQQIAPIADGSGLYVRLGTNRIVRWNLTQGRIDFDRTFPDERMVDLISLAEPVERLAVLFMERILILDGDREVQSLPLLPSLSRRLATIGNQLWAARERELRVYTADSTRLNLQITRPILTPSSDLRFTTDGTWAMFDGYLFHLADQWEQRTLSSGAPPIPGFDGSYLGYFDPVLSRVSTSGLGTLAAFVVPGLRFAGPLADQVRWGTNGFAFRTQAGLIVSARSPIIPGGTADIAVSIEAAGPTRAELPSDFRVVITNRGPDRVDLIHLDIYPRDADWITTTTPSIREHTRVRQLLGPIEVGESVEARVTVLPNRWASDTSSVVLTAVANSSAVDPTPEDASTWTQFRTTQAVADLGLHVQQPVPPEVNVPFEVVCILTNAGPESVLSPSVNFQPMPGLQWLGQDRGTSTGQSFQDHSLIDIIPVLHPGESVTVRIRLRALRPGHFDIVARILASASDENWQDNVGQVRCHIPSPAGSAAFPNLALHHPFAAWSTARQQWILGTTYGLTFLKAGSLEPAGSLNFPGFHARYFLGPDGSHVWLPEESASFTRYDLATGAISLRVPAGALSGMGGIVASPVPGYPDHLAIYGRGGGPSNQAVLIANGVVLPDAYWDDEIWHNRSLFIAASDDQRIYVSTGFQLRELDVTPSGLRFRRNLDAIVQQAGQGFSVSHGLLLSAHGNPVDLETLNEIPLGILQRTVSDGRTVRTVMQGDTSARYEAIDLRTRRPLWWVQASPPPWAIAGGGNQGLLALGEHAGLLIPPADRTVQLSLTSLSAPFIPGVLREFSVAVGIRQQGQWYAQDTRVEVDMPEGFEWIEPQASGTPRGLNIPFFTTTTNFTLKFRATNPGPATLVIRARSGSSDPNVVDARLALNLVVPQPPTLFLSDVVTADNGVPFTLRLNQPAPQNITVRLVAEHVTTESNDLVSPTLDVTFRQGQSEAAVRWVRSDSTVETDEVFLMTVTGGIPANTDRPIRVTIQNDDLATLQTRAENRFEGNGTATAGNISVFTQTMLEATIEIGFTTLSLSATSGEDFVPVSGRLLLTPGNPTNTVQVPILGDLLFEPDETLALRWLDPVGVRLPDPAQSAVLSIINDDQPPAPDIAVGLDVEGRAVISFPTRFGVRYTLQSRTNLAAGSWANEGSVVVGTGSALNLRPPLRLDEVRFYRLQTL